MTDSDFYLAFENRHRGSRELISSRLEAYLPFIQPLLGFVSKPKAFDLGCGRGEWLELLAGKGFAVQGVDVDPFMVQTATSLGLPVIQGDGIEYLAVQPDDSLAVISAFHVVEHIPFNELQRLVQHAERCLIPGGILILETPNPENIAVGTSSFYLDPTHQRPIPPELLSFLPEYYGFARHKVLRLQESPDLHVTPDEAVLLAPVIFGASPDYSVVSQKQAPSQVKALFDDAFAVDHGLSVMDLAQRHDRGVVARDARAEGKVAELEGRAAELEGRAAELEGRAAELEGRAVELGEWQSAQSARDEVLLTQLDQRLTHLFAVARQDIQSTIEASAARQNALEAELSGLRAHAHDLAMERQALRTSLSWRLTAPLRSIGSIVGYDGSARNRGLRLGVTSRLAAVLMAPVLRNEQRAKKINTWLMRTPVLHGRLRGIALDAGLMRESVPMEVTGQTSEQHGKPTASLNDMPRAAREIHAILSRCRR